MQVTRAVRQHLNGIPARYRYAVESKEHPAGAEPVANPVISRMSNVEEYQYGVIHWYSDRPDHKWLTLHRDADNAKLQYTQHVTARETVEFEDWEDNFTYGNRPPEFARWLHARTVLDGLLGLQSTLAMNVAQAERELEAAEDAWRLAGSPTPER